MRCAVVTSEKIAQANRMDPEFFLTLDKYADEIARVRVTHCEQNAKRILKEVDLTHPALRDVLNLSRGNRTKPSYEIPRVVSEYPIEALAIVVAHQGEILASLEQELSKFETLIKRIENL